MLKVYKSFSLPILVFLIGLFFGETRDLQARDIQSPADALARALEDEPTRDRIGESRALRSHTRFLSEWNVWMIEFFSNDTRLAFLTLNPEGEVVERGPEDDDPSSRLQRVQSLRRELEIARQTGNTAEVQEITQLLNELDGAEESSARNLDPSRLMASIQAFGSYGMNVLLWPMDERNHEDQLRIERWDREAWQFQARVPLAEGRWWDEAVRAGETYRYRIHLESELNPEPFSIEKQVQTASVEDSKLPFFQLRVPEEGLDRMLADVTEHIEIPGTFQWGQQTWPIEIRLRGASTRHALKKSYRIRFKQGSPFKRKVIYLKAEPMDHTMQQEKLSCDLFHANDLPCSEASYVHVELNGRYQGVYLEIEPVRSPFKQHHELPPNGSLIRASTFGSTDHPPIGELRGSGDGLDRLDRFLKAALSLPKASFSTWIKTHMDWPWVRDYLALQVMCHRSEIEADDYFFFQDPTTEKWSFIPWDHNNGNFAVVPYGNRIEAPSISIFPQTIQDLGWRPGHAYLLHSRIFNDATLRGEYLDRLRFLVDAWLLSGKACDRIRENFNRIEKEYAVDPYRTPYAGSDPFMQSADHLCTFVEAHGRRLVALIEEVRSIEKQWTLQSVRRAGDTCLVKLVRHGSGPGSMANLQWICKSSERIHFQRTSEDRMLQSRQTFEFTVPDSLPRGGICYLIEKGDSWDTLENRRPLDFIFIPPLP